MPPKKKKVGKAKKKKADASTLSADDKTKRAELESNLLRTSLDLTRQYKLMQSQLMAKIMELQEHTNVLSDELAVTKRLLSETKDQAEKTIREKNDTITQLTQRIQSMESAYESVLNDALDAMASKVEAARDKWELESHVVQQRNKDALMEFGLSHVAL
eukprot:gene8821-7780_t